MVFPKQKTDNSFENWKQNLIYSLSLDPNFAAFLTHDATWAKKTKTNRPNRDFTDDDDPIPENQRRTVQQKSVTLDLMLGQIANYCSVISRDVIVKNLTSLKQFWLSIRFHLDFSRPVPISSTLMRSRYVKMSVPKIFTKDYLPSLMITY